MLSQRCFLDTAFTAPLRPELLSLGAELDPATEVGQARQRSSSDFVRYDGVLDMWRLVAGAACDYPQMDRRTADWLLELAAQSGAPVEVAFDYSTGYELMESAIHDWSPGPWDRVREVVSLADVGPLTGSAEGEIAAEECFHELRRGRLARHHPLAGHRPARRLHRGQDHGRSDCPSDPVRLPPPARPTYSAARLDQAWLQKWMRETEFGLGGRLPMDVVKEPDGLQALKELVIRVAHGVYS